MAHIALTINQSTSLPTVETEVKAKETISPNQSEDSLESKDDNVGETFETQQKSRMPRMLRFILWFKRWPASMRYLLYLLLGGSILAIPVLVDYFFFVVDPTLPFFFLQSRASIGGIPLMYFCLYTIVLWTVLIGSQYILTIIPAVVVRITTALLGKSIAEWVRPRVEYLEQLNFYIALVVMNFVALVLWAVFFRYTPPPSNIADNINSPDYPWQGIIYKIINCGLVGSIVLLAEKFLLQVIAVGFHQRAYAERLVENQFSFYVLERLYSAKRQKIKQRRAKKEIWTFNKKAAATASPPQFPVDAEMNTTETLELGQLKLESSTNSLVEKEKEDPPVATSTAVSTASSPVSQNDARRRKRVLTQPFDVSAVMRSTRQVVRDVTSATINTFVSGASSDVDIQSSQQARKLAADLFKAVCVEGREFITTKDFYSYFPNKQEARKAFRLFDRDGNGDLTQEEMEATIIQVYKEKQAIVRGIRDLGTTVGKLDRIFLFISLLIMILIWLGIFGISIWTYIVAAGSILLTASFMIGNTARNLFESIIFIFFMHPFDVGDRVEIDGVVYQVQNMGLLVTILHRLDGQELYFANAVLATKPIFNIRRSPHQSDSVTIQVAIQTSVQTLKDLESKMLAFVIENSRDYHPRVDMTVDELSLPTDTETQGKLRVRFSINHKGNWQEGGKRAVRRNNFILALKEAILEFKIYSKVQGSVFVPVYQKAVPS